MAYCNVYFEKQMRKSNKKQKMIKNSSFFDKIVLWGVLSLALAACNDTHLQEKYPNGQPKIIVYKKNSQGQNRVRTFTERGVIIEEHYMKNGKLDSIYTLYDSLGSVQKILDVGDKEDFTGWARIYKDGKMVEKYQVIDAIRDGWHITYRPNGDTSLINYRVNDTCYYVRQRKSPSENWKSYVIPVLRSSKDTFLVGEEIKFVIDYPPLPSSLFKKDDAFLAYTNISGDSYLLENYEKINEFEIDKYWDITKVASEIKSTALPTGINISVCQLVKPGIDGTYECLGSTKKKFVVVERQKNKK